jgi:cation transport regulator ChaC
MAYRRWLGLDTKEGPIQGLVFWVGPKGANIRRSLPLDVAAAQMARARGPRGSTAEYFYNTVQSLEEHCPAFTMEEYATVPRSFLAHRQRDRRRASSSERPGAAVKFGVLG